MKTLHMFTSLHGGQKIPFALNQFTTAQPIAAGDVNLGTYLYGVGAPVGGIAVKETIGSVNETVEAWLKSDAAARIQN